MYASRMTDAHFIHHNALWVPARPRGSNVGRDVRETWSFLGPKGRRGRKEPSTRRKRVCRGARLANKNKDA